MLWIISVSSTVLPTPAPPNSPALPPRSSGTSTSMTLMPVSKISDLVERRASGGGARWTERHWTSAGAALPVDGVAEHVEHSRQNRLAHRRLQRPARVFHRHAAGEALRGGQRDAAHVMRVELSQHLDDDSPVLSRAQYRVDRRQARRRTGRPRRCRAPTTTVPRFEAVVLIVASLIRAPTVQDDSRQHAVAFIGRSLHFQLRISGMSWPCLSMYCLCSMSLSCIICFR